jgi:hypothetical protein
MKCVFRYEIEFSLKKSGFSYLHGSISYLLGYEKKRCFFLMPTVFLNVIQFFLKPLIMAGGKLKLPRVENAGLPCASRQEKAVRSKQCFEVHP